MSESQLIHLLTISTIILFVVAIVSIILLTVLFKQNNELSMMNKIVFENEQDLANKLDEAVNALIETNNTLIGHNPDGKFNIQISLNRKVIKAITEK